MGFRFVLLLVSVIRTSLLCLFFLVLFKCLDLIFVVFLKFILGVLKVLGTVVFSLFALPDLILAIFFGFFGKSFASRDVKLTSG